MIRVTLDSNEYVGAFNFGGKALSLIHDAIKGEVEIALSQPILDETLRVFREKFDWEPYRIHQLRERLLKICRMVEPTAKLAVLGDEPDNRILECAQEAGSEYIITEDRAMLRLKEFGAANIMRVADSLKQGRGR